MTEAETGMPAPETRVVVVGTTLVGVSNSDGKYTIRNVPSGPVTVRALRIGLQEVKKTATVPPGSALTLDFSMPRAVIQLQEVVTTATGEQRRAEIANAVTNVNVAEVTASEPITSINDLLQARVPSLAVTPSTQTGSGARIRLRGASSLSLSNDPIYIIDGVRMTSNSASSNIFTGDAQPSRVNDINPDEIENIEVVKGPSAATLYGTDAANGVILITTKKGRAGAPRWNTYAAGGIIKDLNTYPTNYTLAGHAPTDPTRKYLACTLATVSSGLCVADSLRTFSVFDDPSTTPLGTGYRQQYGVQLSGGTESVRYFTGADLESETGVLQIPQFDRAQFQAAGVPIYDYVERPNALGKLSLRANLNATVNPTLDLGVTTNYIQLDQRFAKSSNATAGLGSQAFGGPGYKDNGTVSGVGNPKDGYRAFTPGQIFQEENAQHINRFIGGLNANWRPFSWMQNRANLGIDFTNQFDNDFLPNGQGAPLTARYRLGFKNDSRAQITNFSADLGSSLLKQLTNRIGSRTTFGAQYIDYQLQLDQAVGTQLPPGGQTVQGGTIPSVFDSSTISKTLGLYVEQQVSFNDRLYITAGLRTDQNSAFGTNFQRVYYPKLQAAWTISQESFFRRPSWMDELRLRAAYGASGVQPGPTDALRAFGNSVTTVNGTDQPADLFTAVGNKNLQPERSTEFEGGFESRLFGSRANLDLTYYNKRTKNAIIAAQLPPSLGAAVSVRENLGAVRNRGFELSINSQLIDRRNIGLDLTVTGSTNDNTLLDLGGTPPQVTATSRNAVGYPLFGYWDRKIHYNDKDKNGILVYNANPALSEVTVDDSASFLGSSQPRNLVTITPGIDLFGRKMRVTTLFDYKGGYYLDNDTERIRCGSRNNCRGRNDPHAPLAEQAAAVAFLDSPLRSQAGWIQPVTTWRLREINVTLNAPDRWASRFLRARTASMTFSARNVVKWTTYKGIDPESDYNASSGSDLPAEFQTIAPPSYFILRLNLGF